MIYDENAFKAERDGADDRANREKHKKVLAGNSKAMFANAVKFDQKLKELNDEE